MITRRQILSAGAAAAVLLPAISPATALAKAKQKAPQRPNRAGPDLAFETIQSRLVTLKHLHTHEIQQFLVPDSNALGKREIERFNHFMRDHHNGQVGHMDPSLIFHLLALQRSLEVEGTPFEVVSAYRSNRTNAELRRRSKRVARKSLHLKGQAIDIRLPGVKLGDLHAAALDLRAGGVGLYKRSKFIHFDTGRVRRW